MVGVVSEASRQAHAHVLEANGRARRLAVRYDGRRRKAGNGGGQRGGPDLVTHKIKDR